MESTQEVTRRIVDTFNLAVKEELDQPIEAVKRVLSETEHTNIPERSLLFTLLSDHFLSKGQFSDAFAAASKAYEIDPHRKETLHSLMKLYLPSSSPSPNTSPSRTSSPNNTSNIANKSKSFKTTTNTNNAKTGAKSQKSQNCSKSQNMHQDGKKAKQLADKLINEFPDDIQALNMASTCYETLGLFEPAIEALLRAHALLVESEQMDRFDEHEGDLRDLRDLRDMGDMDDLGDVNDNKSEYRQTLEDTITRYYLDRYRAYADDANIEIMECLVALLQFEDNTLSQEQFKMAHDEICERAEYVIVKELESKNFNLCAKVVQTVANMNGLGRKLIANMEQYFVATGNVRKGIEHFSQMIENAAGRDRTEKMALFLCRSELYQKCGMPKEAERDRTTAMQLDKLRTRTLTTPQASLNNFDRYGSVRPEFVRTRPRGARAAAGRNLSETDHKEEDNDSDLAAQSGNERDQYERKDGESGNCEEESEYKIALDATRKENEKLRENREQILKEMSVVQQNNLKCVKRNEELEQLVEEVQAELSDKRRDYEKLAEQYDKNCGQMNFFRTQWVDSKTNYETVTNRFKSAQNAVAELRMELEAQREKGRNLEKQIKIMKDASEKTKLRRKSQFLLQKDDLVARTPPSRGTSVANASRVQCNMTGKSVKGAFSSELEMKEKMQKINDECNELNCANGEEQKKLEKVSESNFCDTFVKLIGLVLFVLGFLYLCVIVFGVVNKCDVFFTEGFDASILIAIIKNEFVQSFDIEYWHPFLEIMSNVTQKFGFDTKGLQKGAPTPGEL